MGNSERDSGAFRDRAGYLAVRFGFMVVDLMPACMAHAVAGLAARVAFALSRRRRRIASGNVLYAGVAHSAGEARRIARASFLHFAHMLVDVNKGIARATSQQILDMVELDAPTETLALLEDDSRGMLLLSAHIGNWELAGLRIAVSKRTLVIAKRAKNKRVQAFLESRQVRPLYEVVDKSGADLRRLAKAMQSGAAVGMLVDQHARDTTGLPMPVFGHDAAVHTSPAVLYRLSRVPVVFFEPVVVGRMRVRLKLSEPLHFDTTGGREAVVHRLMGRYIEWFEAAVSAHPEQYLWAHRRWRGADAPG